MLIEMVFDVWLLTFTVCCHCQEAENLFAGCSVHRNKHQLFHQPPGGSIASFLDEAQMHTE